MTPFSKDPITFGREQVIEYMTSVTYYSIKKITVRICNYIRYQNDLISVAETIGSPKKGCQFDLNMCVDRQRPKPLIHTGIMTLSKSRRVY